ncbi:MAG: methyltransferase domain-containing protein [Woeseiaceae bacterium]|nr:methyltransferase domain-containing protein [Woeseiaceae bacterium]
MTRGLEQIPWLYDAMMWTQPGLDRWRRKLIAAASGNVLEVGCGTGLALRHYSGKLRVVGLDPSLDALSRARRRLPDTPLVHGSVLALPFADDSFDCVVSSLVFCSVTDPHRGLAELKRVLKPGGRLLMLEHVQASSRLGAWLLDTVQPLWTKVAGGCRPNRRTEALVEQGGFRIDPDSRHARGVLRSFVAYPD